MKRHWYTVFFLCIVFSAYLKSFNGKALLLPRSQSVDAARFFTGLYRQTEHQDSTACVTAEYQRSFRPGDINHYLFGADTLIFSGSRVADRGSCDIMADYFGLPTDFYGTLSFTPRASNILVDISFFKECYSFDYSTLRCGSYSFDACGYLFFDMHVPIVHSRWNLNVCEDITQTGTLNYPAGYMSASIIERSALPKSIVEVFSDEVKIGDMQESLAYGKIACKSRNKTKFADIQTCLGYNILIDDRYRLGCGLHVSVPTGNKPEVKYIFDPIVGNGHHWELGADFTAGGTLWQSCNEDHQVQLFLSATVSHLFKSTQKRSFDFKKNGAGSRYILLEELSKPAIEGETNDVRVIVGTDQITTQYARKLFPAINKTTLLSKISIPYQVDLMANVAYVHGDYSVYIGYNFWLRGGERLHCRDRFPDNCFGLKGDAQLYGFDATQVVALNATQGCATVHSGQGAGNTNHNFNNTNADSVAPAALGVPTLIIPLVLTQSDTISVNNNTGVTSLVQTNGSVDPSVLKDSDIDNDSVLVARSYSSKLFFYGQYDWSDCSCVEPFFGIGTEVEWTGGNQAKRGSFSQWGIWLKGGISY
jgi:hypothetical protein